MIQDYNERLLDQHLGGDEDDFIITDDDFIITDDDTLEDDDEFELLDNDEETYE